MEGLIVHLCDAFPHTQEGERQSDPPVEPGPGLLPKDKAKGDDQRRSSGGNQAAAGRYQPVNPVCVVS